MKERELYSILRKNTSKMKSLRPKQIVFLAIALMIFKLLCVECREPVLHRVGGGQSTWNPNTNFSDWSSHEKFFVGDWLYFGFNKWIYNVLEVNKTSYDNCNDNDYITNVTRGGRDVFNLSEAKVYYFLCGRGFCFQGMKVQVSVNEIPSMPPSPLPQDDLQIRNGFFSYSFGFSTHIMLLTSLVSLMLLP